MKLIKEESYQGHRIQIARGLLAGEKESSSGSDYRVYIDSRDMTREVREISTMAEATDPDLLLEHARQVLDHMTTSP